MGPLEGHRVFVGSRGWPTMNPQALMDIRLERIFRCRGRDLAVSLDVFNLWSSAAITALNDYVNYGPYYGFDRSLTQFSGALERNQYFQAPVERTRPRTVRMGAAWYF